MTNDQIDRLMRSDAPMPNRTTDESHTNIFCPTCAEAMPMPEDAYDEAIFTCANAHTFTRRDFFNSLGYWN